MYHIITTVYSYFTSIPDIHNTRKIENARKSISTAVPVVRKTTSIVIMPDWWYKNLAFLASKSLKPQTPACSCHPVVSKWRKCRFRVIIVSQNIIKTILHKINTFIDAHGFKQLTVNITKALHKTLWSATNLVCMCYMYQTPSKLHLHGCILSHYYDY